MRIMLKVYQCMDDDTPGSLVSDGLIDQEVAIHLLTESLNPVMTAALGTKMVDMSASEISFVLNTWHPILLGRINGVPTTERHYYVLSDHDTKSNLESASELESNATPPMTGVRRMDQLKVLIAAHVEAWAVQQPDVYSGVVIDKACEVLEELDQIIGPS